MKRSHRIIGGTILLLGLRAVWRGTRSKTAAPVITPPPPDVIVASVKQRALPVDRQVFVHTAGVQYTARLAS